MMTAGFFKNVLPAAAGLLLLTSCSRHLRGTDNVSAIVYPSPPDTARIQFLTSIKGSADVKKQRTKFSKYIFGEDLPLPVQKPYGISIFNGKLVICDVDLKGLDILDFNKKTFEQFKPEGKGRLKLPVNCFIDPNGILYVADVERHEIVVFDWHNNYINSFGDTGTFKPTDVFVFGDKVYVTDAAGNKVNIYRKGFLNLIDYFPKAQKGDSGYLFQPTNIYVTGDKIYISDFGDFKIKIYSHDGNFLGSVGSYGKMPGQFVRPKGIAVDSAANLFVVDAGFENVQLFNNDGRLLMYFGGAYKGAGDMWLPAKVCIDYNNKRYFSRFVNPSYDLKYLIFVTNQYGPDKINVYGAIEPARKKE